MTGFELEDEIDDEEDDFDEDEDDDDEGDEEGEDTEEPETWQVIDDRPGRSNDRCSLDFAD